MMQEMTQEMKNLMLDTIRDIHTVVPGKIVSFDPDKCEATVQPIAKFRKPDGVMIDFPKIYEVPVYFPQSALQKVTFVYHIKPDDECLLLFLEQALDQWRTGAESNTELRYDLQNCVAIPGLFAKANPLVKRAHDNESIIIQREETFVELYDGMIETLVKEKANGIGTYHLMVDGRADTLAFTVKSLGDEQTVTVNIDGNSGQIDVTAKGDINVSTEKNLNVDAAQNINITAEQNINITAAQNISVTAEGTLDIKSTGALSIKSDDSILIEAPRVDINP